VPAKLYVLHGSHPSMAVAKALEIKGVPYKTVELFELAHIPHQRLRFGGPSVPSIKFEDREKVQGSVAIMRRLEERVPEPRLYPEDPGQRERVEELERWGDEVLQQAARRPAWWGLAHNPRAMPSYTEGSRWRLPAPVTRTVGPLVARGASRVHGATDEAVRSGLAELPAHLDRIDAAIADGVIGGDQPNAADLQVASSVRLLMTYEDVRPTIEGRPARALAERLFPEMPGTLPAGTLPV
jgi:glutathione S-transferase